MESFTVKKYLERRILFLICVSFSILSFAYAYSKCMEPQFAWWGDEYAHFLKAQEFAKGINLSMPYKPGVYKENSIFLSYYPAFFMCLIAPTLEIWRASFLFLIIPCSILCYLIGTKLWGKWVGASASVLFSSSFYVHNFYTIGYPNSLTSFFILLLFYLTIRLYYEPIPRLLYFVFYGGLMGLSTYVYMGPIVPLVLAPYLLSFRISRIGKKDLKINDLTVVCILAFLVVSLPCLISGAMFNDGIKGRLIDGTGSFSVEARFRNALIGSIAFLVNSHVGHFIAGSTVDALSGCMVGLGIVVILFNVRRKERLLLLPSYLLTCLAIGFSNPNWSIPFSRTVATIPFLCLIGGVGAGTFLVLMPKPARFPLLLILMISLVLINIDRSNYYFKKVGISDVSCVFWHYVNEQSTSAEQKRIVVRYHRAFADNFLRTVLNNYGYSNVELITVPKDMNYVPGPLDVVIDLKFVDQDKCISLGNNVKQILPYDLINLIQIPKFLLKLTVEGSLVNDHWRDHWYGVTFGPLTEQKIAQPGFYHNS